MNILLKFCVQFFYKILIKYFESLLLNSFCVIPVKSKKLWNHIA